MQIFRNGAVLTWPAFFLLLFLPSALALESTEEVRFFNTSAYWDEAGDVWVVPVHGFVFKTEARSLFKKVTLWAAGFYARHERAEDRERMSGPEDPGDPESVEESGMADPELMRQRGLPFFQKGKSGRQLTVLIAGKEYLLEPSTEEGHIKTAVKISQEQAQLNSNNGWIEYEVMLPDDDPRIFRGKAQLVPPEGLSIISDIDDTIKVSEVLKKEELLENTFLYAFHPVAGMVDRYQAWKKTCEATFHYVSLAPWQLAGPLDEFLRRENFPEGSFHLRYQKPLGFGFFFQRKKNAKEEEVRNILKQYPKRRFILIGDSAQKDPAIYASIAQAFPEQILHVYIRDIRQNQDDREVKLEPLQALSPEQWSLLEETAETFSGSKNFC